MINRNLLLLSAAILALALGAEASAERRDNPLEGERGNRTEEPRPEGNRPEYRSRERRPDERRPDEFRPDERREDRSRDFGNRDRSNREFGTPDRLVRPSESEWQSGRRFPHEDARDPGRNSGLDERVVALGDAVSMVQSRFNATAVKTDTVTEGGQLVYRIRLLSADKSRVWTVRVDARTGRIN